LNEKAINPKDPTTPYDLLNEPEIYTGGIKIRDGVWKRCFLADELEANETHFLKVYIKITCFH
jgi:hypothetical protein